MRLGPGDSGTLQMNADLNIPLGCRSLRLILRAESGTTTGGQATIEVRTPELLSPSARAELDNACANTTDTSWRFDWSSCPGADEYQLFVKSRTAPVPLVDVSTSTRSDYTVRGLGVVADPDRLGWVWRVRARFGSQWADWTPQRIFNVGPEGTNCQ